MALTALDTFDRKSAGSGLYPFFVQVRLAGADG
jgi:hypothetical protein